MGRARACVWQSRGCSNPAGATSKLAALRGTSRTVVHAVECPCAPRRCFRRIICRGSSCCGGSCHSAGNGRLRLLPVSGLGRGLSCQESGRDSSGSSRGVLRCIGSSSCTRGGRIIPAMGARFSCLRARGNCRSEGSACRGRGGAGNVVARSRAGIHGVGLRPMTRNRLLHRATACRLPRAVVDFQCQASSTP